MPYESEGKRQDNANAATDANFAKRRGMSQDAAIEEEKRRMAIPPVDANGHVANK